MLKIRSRVGPKGQAVIPKPVREALGIRPGDEVFFSAHDDHAHVEKVQKDDWESFFGRLPRLRLPARFDVDQIVEEEIHEDLRREHERQ